MNRIAVALTMITGVLGIATPVLLRPTPMLIWNASASVPIGLYAVRPVDRLYAGELLALMPPAKLASFLDRRRYLPVGLPMLKHLAAVPGQTVCRTRRVITVDRKRIGTALERDHLGRPLPVWQGCRLVAPGDIFPMNPQSPASFDGRYFGPLAASVIIGQATPIWTRTGRRP